MMNGIFGRNITVRELHSFFFDTLGMMSITFYGARGDNRTDNYANLQVAIDDANKRKLRYLYVPFGRYLYVGNLINRENIVFVGNPNAEIVNPKTGETIPVHQFGVCEYGCLKYGNCAGGGNMPNPEYSDKLQANNGEAYFDSLDNWIGYEGYAVYLYMSSKIAIGDSLATLRLPQTITSFTLDTIRNIVEQIHFENGSYIEGTYDYVKYFNASGEATVLYSKNSEGIFERQIRKDYFYDIAFNVADSLTTVTTMSATTYFIGGLLKAIYDGTYIWTTSGWEKAENPNPESDDIIIPW